MYNKLVSSSIMSFHKEKRTTFIELVEPVVSEEKVLQSTLSYQTMLHSSERSRIITILRLKRCPKIWKISIPLVNNENNDQKIYHIMFHSL